MDFSPLQLILGFLTSSQKRLTPHSQWAQIAFPTDSKEPVEVSRGRRASSLEQSGYYKFTAA